MFKKSTETVQAAALYTSPEDRVYAHTIQNIKTSHAEEIGRWEKLYNDEVKKAMGAQSLQDRVDELEKQLAHALADIRIQGMMYERMAQVSVENFNSEMNKMVEQANARIAELEGQVAAAQPPIKMVTK